MKIVVHRFSLGDVEDPDLYAAQPLWEWQQSEQGKWVMENAVETPVWERHIDTSQYNQIYRIVAKFTEENATFFQLKWGIK